MIIKIKSLLTALTMLFLFGIQAEAATVSILPSLSKVAPLDALELEMVGTDFTSGADAGDFSVSWDPSVIDYIGTILSQDPWDFIASIDEKGVDAGELFVVVATTEEGGAGPDFDIGKISFGVVGPVGSSTRITAADDDGWVAPGAVPIEVTYDPATVNVVPVPAAVWLFISGLLGLLGISIRKKA